MKIIDLHAYTAFSEKISSYLGKTTVTNIAEAHSTYRYKFLMDRDYKQRCFRKNFDNIVVSITTDNLSLAVNSCISPINNLINYEDRMDPKFILLNIFPLNQKYKVIFSFRRDHSNIVNEFLNPILSATGKYQQYLISKLVLQNCENFVLTPDYYTSFSQAKKNDIIKYFSLNMFAKKTDYENENLFLF